MFICEISGSNGGEFEDDSLLEYITPENLVKVDRRFKGVYSLHHRLMMMDAACTSETSVYSNKTWRYIPEGCRLQDVNMFCSERRTQR
jgi:hypothetical protein